MISHCESYSQARLWIRIFESFPGSLFFAGKEKSLEVGLERRNTPNSCAVTQKTLSPPHARHHFPIGILSLIICNLLDVAFRKLQHIVPLLHIRCPEGELRQSKISELWDTIGTARSETIGTSLKAGCGAISLTKAYLGYPSSPWATPARAARETLGRAISSLGFQVGHVDLHVVPCRTKIRFNFNLCGIPVN